MANSLRRQALRRIGRGRKERLKRWVGTRSVTVHGADVKTCLVVEYFAFLMENGRHSNGRCIAECYTGARTSTLNHVGERFRDVQYSFVSFLFAVLKLMVPPPHCPVICKVDGHVLFVPHGVGVTGFVAPGTMPVWCSYDGGFCPVSTLRVRFDQVLATTCCNVVLRCCATSGP